MMKKESRGEGKGNKSDPINDIRGGQFLHMCIRAYVYCTCMRKDECACQGAVAALVPVVVVVVVGVRVRVGVW